MGGWKDGARKKTERKTSGTQTTVWQFLGRGGGEGEEGRGGCMVMEEDVIWGGEHTIQCTNDVFWNCTPEMCIIVLTSVTPTGSIKKKKK